MTTENEQRALLRLIVDAYDTLVAAELQQKPDIIEAARNALASRVDDAKKALGLHVRGGTGSR